MSPEQLERAQAEIRAINGRDCDRFHAPDRVDGCHWEAWGGPFGISPDGMVFDGGDSAIGDINDLPPNERFALAQEMIRRWNAFCG